MCVMDVFVFKQKTAYEMRISDWSSDVCSSDLRRQGRGRRRDPGPRLVGRPFERLFAGAAPRGGQGVETRPPRPVRPESFADRRADGADAYLCEEPAAAGEDRQGPRARAYHRRRPARKYPARPAEDTARAYRRRRLAAAAAAGLPDRKSVV